METTDGSALECGEPRTSRRYDIIRGMEMTRRNFLAAGVALGMAGYGKVAAREALPCVGERYPGWRQGELDIHFIQTGTGEQTFFIFPDGTTMLLDCGDFYWEKWADHTIPRRPGR